MTDKSYRTGYQDGYMNKRAGDNQSKAKSAWKYNIRRPTPINEKYTTAYSPSRPDNAFDARLKDDPSQFRSVKGLPTVGIHGHGGGRSSYSVDNKDLVNSTIMNHVSRAVPSKGDYALNIDACNLGGGCHPALLKAMKDFGHLNWKGRTGHWIDTRPPKYVSRAPAYTVGHNPDIDGPDVKYPAFDLAKGLPVGDEDYRRAARFHGRTWKTEPSDKERAWLESDMKNKAQPYQELRSIMNYWADPKKNTALITNDSPVKQSLYPDSSLNEEWGNMVDKYKQYIASKVEGDDNWKKFVGDFANMTRSENFSRLGGPSKIWLQESEKPGKTQSRARLFHRSNERAKSMGIPSPFDKKEYAAVGKALDKYDSLRKKHSKTDAMRYLYLTDRNAFKLVLKALSSGMTIANKDNKLREGVV